MMKKSMTLIYKIAVLFILSTVSCKGKEKEIVAPQSGTDIEKVQLTDLNGQLLNIKQYAGKTVFINFWATWCKPCIAEMPSIEKAKNKLSDQNIVFLLASNESIPEIQDFKNSNTYTSTYLRIENMEALNIQAIPTTYIFNPQGKLVFSEMGYRNWDDSANINLILKIVKIK